MEDVLKCRTRTHACNSPVPPPHSCISWDLPPTSDGWVVMVTMVKCEGYLHGSCSNSTVMSFCRIRVLVFISGSNHVGLSSCSSACASLHHQLLVSHTAEAPHASAPFNLRPTRGLHRQRWKDMLGKLLITIHAHTKLTDLIR